MSVFHRSGILHTLRAYENTHHLLSSRRTICVHDQSRDPRDRMIPVKIAKGKGGFLGVFYV